MVICARCGGNFYCGKGNQYFWQYKYCGPGCYRESNYYQVHKKKIEAIMEKSGVTIDDLRFIDFEVVEDLHDLSLTARKMARD